MLNKETLKDSKPDFVVIYHPLCPYSYAMINEWKKLAKEAKRNSSPVNIVAINASKLDKFDLHIRGYP